MLLIIEKGIRGGICHSIHQYAKAYNNYMKDCDKNKESRIFNIGMQIIYMVGQCRKSFRKIFLSGSKILLNLMKI